MRDLGLSPRDFWHITHLEYSGLLEDHLATLPGGGDTADPELIAETRRLQLLVERESNVSGN